MKRWNCATALRVVAALSCGPMISACASTGGIARPSPFPTAPASPAAWGPAPKMTAPVLPSLTALVSTALSFRGVPYVSGGEDPHGFDCSGFVRYVFGLYHVDVPRTVAEQFVIGNKTKEKAIRAGDLLFFATTGSGPSHVAIALNNDEFVHAPSASGAVRVEHLSSSYWHERFLVAKRLF